MGVVLMAWDSGCCLKWSVEEALVFKVISTRVLLEKMLEARIMA